jgi:DNA-binding NarL/FixJ family response regulator
VSSLPEPDQGPRLRVLVADDHGPMLDSLVSLLAGHFDVVAAVADGTAAVEAAQRLKPDVMVLDIAMPGLNGIAAAAQLKSGGSRASVVFVTMHYAPEYVQKALELGTVGFVAKNRLVMDLLPAIRAVESGRSFVSPTLTH